MTTVAGDAPTWGGVADAADGVLANWCALHRGLWEVVDPRTLELCRLRIAALLGAERHLALRSPAAAAVGVDDDLIADLAAWPTSGRFTPADRACLALAEQFLVDVSGIDQPLIDGVLTHFTPGECYALVNALWAVEAVQRTCEVLDTMPEPSELGLVRGGS